MAKYSKRKDGRFYTLINTGKFDDDGNPIRISVYGTSSRDLENKVSEIKTDLKRGTYADDRGTLFKDYADKWEKTYVEGHLEAGTVQKYRGILKNHLGGIDNMRLMDIKKTDIQMLFKNKSVDIQHMIKITVHQVLDCAIEDGLLYKNVSDKIHPDSRQRSTSRRPLTEAEKEAIRKCKAEQFDINERVFIDTLFVSGLRTEEILALSRRQINISDSSITIDSAMTYKGGKQLKGTKNGLIRTIPVPSWYMKELTEYLSDINSLFVFPGYNGELISQSVYKRFWQNIYNKINCAMGGTPDVYKKNKLISKGIHATDITPYFFRHNYATMLYYSGVQVKEAQYLLGHASIKITLEIYTHLMERESDTKAKLEQIAL